MSTRGELWRQVYTERDDDRADWNGFEACFPSADDYDSWTRRVAEILKQNLVLTEEDVVADLGCGTGRIASLVAPHVRAVLAYDYSPTVLSVAMERRPADNISYALADLNVFDVATLPITKAYSVSALLYLDSEVRLFGLLEGLKQRGIAVAVIDVPDADQIDSRPRGYDTSLYTHLRLSEADLRRRFPSGTVIRGEFPGYVNGPTRFNFYLT